MIWLPEEIVFPPYEFANEDGVLAFGGDLSAKRLIHAYKNGIFPWFNEGEPIVWYSPPERMVLFPQEVKVSKSMRQVLRKGGFTITENKAFKEVIFNCRHIDRNDQLGTWITDDMEDAFIHLAKNGGYKLIDCQVHNEHLESLGAREIDRNDFLRML